MTIVDSTFVILLHTPAVDGLTAVITHPIMNFQIMTVDLVGNLPIISKKIGLPAKEINTKTAWVRVLILRSIANTLRTSNPVNFPLRDDFRPHGRVHEEI
ncbi:MAG: hypothetical protein ACT6U0_03080 [Shinella sp.]